MQDNITNHLITILRKQRLLSPERIEVVDKESKQYRLPLLHYLITEKILPENIIAKSCAKHLALPIVHLHNLSLDPGLLNHLPKAYQYSYLFLPIKKEENSILIAINDPNSYQFIDDVKFQIAMRCEFAFTTYESFMLLVSNITGHHVYRSLPIRNHIKLTVTQIFNEAVYRKASDIHLETHAHTYRIRIRIDGLLHHITDLPFHIAAPISSYLKILSDLDISQKRLPQDGRLTIVTTTKITQDARISICPTLFGEKIVIRLFRPTQCLLALNQLGLNAVEKKQILKSIYKPQGLILVTGPTGSGKTTSLYAMLNLINSPCKNISSAEDPIEIPVNGINQVNIHQKIGLGFPAVLKAFLRQDPDIIMIGEIRDQETARIAIQAAETGHLVLSTLHTNSAVESIDRLLDMGIELFHITNCLSLVIAQRLIRTICPHCQQEKQHCDFCINGYRGRIGVYEMFPITPQIKTHMIRKKSTSDMLSVAKQEGMQTLWELGLEKVKQGITTFKEIHRVIQCD